MLKFQRRNEAPKTVKENSARGTFCQKDEKAPPKPLRGKDILLVGKDRLQRLCLKILTNPVSPPRPHIQKYYREQRKSKKPQSSYSKPAKNCGRQYQNFHETGAGEGQTKTRL